MTTTREEREDVTEAPAGPRPGSSSWRRIGLRLVRKALDLVFPRICPLCGRLSDRDDRFVCWSCLSKIPLTELEAPHCVCCGKVPAGAVDRDFLCDDCRAAPPAYDMARFAAPFRHEVRDLIHAFKYRKATWLREDLADLLEGCVSVQYDVAAIDWIVPVPLHPAKYVKRSYNQADYLAKSLSRRTGRPFSPALVERFRQTPTQTHLSARARRMNVRGAFRVVSPGLVRGRTILLVDDVMTTGSTLSAIAAVLKEAGAWRVWAATIARG